MTSGRCFLSLLTDETVSGNLNLKSLLSQFAYRRDGLRESDLRELLSQFAYRRDGLRESDLRAPLSQFAYRRDGIRECILKHMSAW
jgi:hypothetical protein